MSTIYTKEYFIAKFEAIPDERWIENAFADDTMKCRCALGHCGDDGWWRGSRVFDEVDKEVSELCGLLNQSRDNPEGFMSTVEAINNGLDTRYPQPTPKARILAALADLP